MRPSQNIRLGNVSIHINRIDELEKQLVKNQDVHEKTLADARSRLRSVEERFTAVQDDLDTANSKLRKATKQLGIYELQVGGRIYRGRSHDPESRIR